MNPEQHVQAAISELVADGIDPNKVDRVIQTFAYAVGGLLGCVQAASQGDISDDLLHRRIDEISEYMKFCAKSVSDNYGTLPSTALN
jgi:hypothetical protein